MKFIIYIYCLNVADVEKRKEDNPNSFFYFCANILKIKLKLILSTQILPAAAATLGHPVHEMLHKPYYHGIILLNILYFFLHYIPVFE